MAIGGVLRSRAIPLLTSQCAQAAQGPPRLDRDRRGLLAPSFFGADGKSEVVATDLVIGADGIGSAVARLVGAQVLREGRHASSVVYGHCSGLDAAGYSWYYREGVSAGIIPTNGGAHGVFAAVPSNRFGDEVRHNLAAGYGRALAEVSPTLAAAVAMSRLEGRLWAFAGRRGFLREAWGPGGRSSAMPATSRIR
jgi:hypothetical protein